MVDSDVRSSGTMWVPVWLLCSLKRLQLSSVQMKSSMGHLFNVHRLRDIWAPGVSCL